jgi:flavin-dependent thymidylate synthase
MRVNLISHTAGALELLLRTKNTRLGFDSDPETWSAEKKTEHLEYMRDTLKSSWEFCVYVFEIEDVSRSFTHQLVRTRTGSYAQESQRTVDVSDHPIVEPPAIANDLRKHQIWEAGAETARQAYAALIEEGAKPGDARGVLPTNVSTSIVAQFSLRTLHEMAKVRLCTRASGEYQNVFRAMRDAVHAVHPWVQEHAFLEVACVADGICAFPRYGKKECPIYDPIMDQSQAKLLAKARWETIRFEASPVAAGGKAS